MRKGLLFGIAFTLFACGRDDTVPTSPNPSSISGSYTLETIDGHVLPFTVIDLGAYQGKLASGTLNLKADGTYSLEMGIRIEDSGNVRNVATNDAGTWTRSGNALTLVSTQGTMAPTGIVSGNTITLQSSIRVLVLRK